MGQPVKRGRLSHPAAKKKDVRKPTKKKVKIGTSKLEKIFEDTILSKLGVRYEYQYHMRSIGRYLDFYLPDKRVAIEVDGDYYHGYGLQYEQKSPMQKKNERVDRQKDKWCGRNGILMIRIWEHDIRKNPSKVRDMLIETINKRN